MSELKETTNKIKQVIKIYKENFPDVVIDRDYYPFKLTEELGECMQTYLMLTDRGRQKDMSKEEIRIELAKEMADVFGYILAFADSEGIDLEEAIEEKWFSYLKSEEKQDN